MHAALQSLQILEKEKLLQKKLLSKEKRNWLGFIQAGGSASYGIADNVASNTDVNTPLIYRYVGTEQTSWNVGGASVFRLKSCSPPGRESSASESK